MSELPLTSTKVGVLINGHTPENMLSYVASQAIACDQVVCWMAIRNSILIEWAKLKVQSKCYVDLLNGIIPDGTLRIKHSSEPGTIEDRIKVQCHKVNSKLKELQKNGSREGRQKHLDNMTRISIKVSDVIPAAQLELELKQMEEKVAELQNRLDNLNVEVDEWRNKYKDLEDEKKKLYEEIEEEMSNKVAKKVSGLEQENEAMRKYIRKLERETKNPNILKEQSGLSKGYATRRLNDLGDRAKKALWFIDWFGLKLESLEFKDTSGSKYRRRDDNNKGSLTPPHKTAPIVNNIETPPSTPQTPPMSLDTSSSEGPANNPQTPTSAASTTPPPTPNSNPTPKASQYETLSEEEKGKVETVLFLMDKFAVGDSFIHELSMSLDGMPKSYLIKQCRKMLNSTCAIKPTPGEEPGAQISFKESLVNQLQQLVSILVVLCILFM